jgi:hypothetical protein
MARNLVLLIFALNCFSVVAQGIRVDSVNFGIQNSYDSPIYVPIVRADDVASQAVVEKINDELLETLIIDSFDPLESEEFHWYGLAFNYEITSDYLLLSYSGEYVGAYLNWISDDLYFDLKTGDLLNKRVLEYNSLFSQSGYYQFMNKYWLPDCKIAIEEAVECSEMEAYCGLYDIEIQINEEKVEFLHKGDCFPRFAIMCNPEFLVSVAIDSLKPYMNDFAKNLLYKTNFKSMSKLERFIFYNQHFADVPDYYYLEGKIDNKYPFSMSLEFNNQDSTVSGFYFYHSQNKNIDLRGYFMEDELKLKEFVNDKETGSFIFKMAEDFFPSSVKTGRRRFFDCYWINAKTNAQFKVELNDDQINRY